MSKPDCLSAKNKSAKKIWIPHLAADLYKGAQGQCSCQLSAYPYPSLATAMELAHKDLERASWVVTAEQKGLPVSASSAISGAASVDLSSLR